MDLLLLAELLDKTWVIHTVAEYSYVGVFLFLLACGFGLPCPEELPLIGGGFAIYQAGLLDPARGGLDDALLMVAVAMVGVLIGDLILYTIGRRVGRRPHELPIFGKVLTEERVEQVRALFQKHGAKTVFFGRFAFGIRAPVFLLSGSMRIPLRTFIPIDALAASITVPTAVLLAWYFGAQLDQGIDAIAQANKVVLVVIGALFLITVGVMLRHRAASHAAEPSPPSE